MVTQVQLELASQQPVSFSHAFALFCSLANRTGAKYRENLRKPGLKSVSQYLFPNSEDGCSAVQVVNLLSEEAHNHLLPILLKLSEYHLPGLEAPAQVVSVSVQRIDEAALVNRFFAGPVPETGTGLTLLTPTAFRMGGGYAVFPSAELILRDAAARFNNLGLQLQIEPAALDRIVSGARIDGYKLQSSLYPLGDKEVPGFVGRLVLSANLSDPLARIFRMLLHALRFTGTGVKPSLGMGAVEVRDV